MELLCATAVSVFKPNLELRKGYDEFNNLNNATRKHE